MPGLGQHRRQRGRRGCGQGQLAERRRRQVRHRLHQLLHIGAAQDVAGGRAEFLDIRRGGVPGADGDLVRRADGAHFQVRAHLAEPQLVEADAGQEGDGVVAGIGSGFRDDVGAVAAGEDKGVVADAAREHVGALAALQGVVAEAACQGVGQFIAGQHVIIGAAFQAAEIDQHVAARTGRGGSAAGNDAGRRASLRPGVGGRAVRAAAAQHVAAGHIDVKYIVIAVARHRQAGGAYMHLLDVGGQRVINRGIHGIAAAASLLNHYVAAVVDVIRVVASQPSHHVGACRALDDVRIRRAREHAIDGLVRAFRAPVLRQRRRQGGGCRRWQGQLAGRRRRQARHRLHQVLHVRAQQHAAVGHAEFLDAGRDAGAIPAADGDFVRRADGAHFQRRAHLAEPQLVGADAGQESDDIVRAAFGHFEDAVGAVAAGENIGIVAYRAGKHVIALAAAQDIVAYAADERVFEFVAGQHIVELAAYQVAEIEQHVGPGRRRQRAIRTRQGGGHAHAGIDIADRIDGAATVEHIAAWRLHMKGVVGRGAARHRQAAADDVHVLHVGGHRVVDAGVHGIRAAVGQFDDHVAAVVDVIRVVAGQAFEHVGAAGAAEHIGIGGAGEALRGRQRGTVQVRLDGGNGVAGGCWI
ncbi:hypothetical protein JaAD80_27160 [Janthinobacterium sp. AD80]|nr:hypothetical protein JaAD80_27160 [Janthinobacterium sp. AD80]